MSVLSVRLSGAARSARPAPRALDEACAGGPRHSRTAQDVSKTSGDAPRRPDIAAQAPGASLWPPYRVHGQFAAVARLGGMSNAKRCWRVSRLLFAPKVHFRNTDLEKECPLRVFAPARLARPAPRALDEACASGPRPSRTAQEVSKTSGDAPRRPDIAAQAPGASL